MIRMAFVLFSLTSACARADVASDAAQWFESKYASNYTSLETTDPEILRRSYHDGNWYIDPVDGAAIVPNSKEAQTFWLEQQVANGWKGIDLVSVSAVELNAKAVTLEAKWVTRMANGPPKRGCYFYLAAKQNGGWRFVSVAEIACNGDP